MSDNVEVVRSFKEAINAADADALAALVGSQFEFRSIFTGVEGRTYRGSGGVRRYLADLAEAWERIHIHIEEQRDVGDGRVLTVMRVRTRGKASGAESDVPLASIARVREGKLVEYESYRDLDEARAVAALSPSGSPRSRTA